MFEVSFSGEIIIGTTPEQFSELIALLSMHQNTSLIDDLEFSIDKKAKTLSVRQADELFYLFVDANLPFSFFDKFEVKGNIDSFVLRVRDIMNAVDSMFRSYDKLMVKIVFKPEESPVIILTSSKERYETKVSEKSVVHKDNTNEVIGKLDELGILYSFETEPEELVNIGYNDNTEISFLVKPEDSKYIVLHSKSDSSQSKYTKKLSIESFEAPKKETTSNYNLVYLKHVLINQKGKVKINMYTGGLMNIIQYKPFEANFYVTPTEPEEED